MCMMVPVDVLNQVLDEENHRSYVDAKTSESMTTWETNINTYWEGVLDTDYANYEKAVQDNPDDLDKADPNAGGKSANEWSKQYDTDQTTMQTEVQETDATVKTTSGQVSQNQSYISQVTQAMSSTSQIMQYLSSLVKTKL